MTWLRFLFLWSIAFLTWSLAWATHYAINQRYGLVAFHGAFAVFHSAMLRWSARQVIEERRS